MSNYLNFVLLYLDIHTHFMFVEDFSNWKPCLKFKTSQHLTWNNLNLNNMKIPWFLAFVHNL